MKLHRLIPAFALALLAGCASLGNLVSPASTTLVTVAADVAVAAAVGNVPGLQRAKAQTIVTIARQALALDTGSTVPLAQLEAGVNAQIAALHLPAGDQAAATILVATIEQVINQKLTAGGGTATTPTGTVTSSTKVAIAQVLNAVINICVVGYGAT